MHHKYSILKEGDRVLNIASGTAWTQLIVKYTRSSHHSPNIITVSDKNTFPVKGSHLIKGDINDPQIRVDIVELLKQ